MSRGLNKVMLIGHLGKDPELRTTTSGQSVCTLSIATPDRYKDKNGEWQESTDWHTVVLWERLADNASQYLKKGKKVFIEGRIKYRSYEKDGVTKYITDIVAREMIFLDSREHTGEAEHYPSQESGYNSSASQVESHVADGFDDDEVPF